MTANIGRCPGECLCPLIHVMVTRVMVTVMLILMVTVSAVVRVMVIMT